MFSLNLTTLGVAAAAALALLAGVFAMGRSSGVDAERKRLDPKVGAICQAAGASWAEVDAKGKPLARATWGRACQAAAADLMTFKTTTLRAQQQALEDAQAEQAAKTQADQLAAQRDAGAQRQAQHNMEKADAAVRDDRVDGDWLRALGELGGLRQPAQGPAGAAVPATRGAPAR